MKYLRSVGVLPVYWTFSLSLYFGGHLLAGLPAEAILLFLLGLILLAIEIFIPGFGLPGISGLVCLVISIVWLHLVGKQV